MHKTLLLVPFVLILAVLAPFCVHGAESSAAPRVTLEHDDDHDLLRVLIDGQEALVYCYGSELEMPHLYPIRSPDGQSMTVQYPKPPARFPHHRSFWFADKVRMDRKRKADFYSAFYSSKHGKRAGKPPFRNRIRHVEFLSEQTTDDQAVVMKKLVWETDYQVPLVDELREMRVVALGNGEYFVDLTFTVTAAYGDVTFASDATHYAWPYVRINPQFSVDGGGTLTNSEGGVNQKQTHKKVARWVDVSNTVDGRTSGLTLMSHSDNVHPHRWLTRDYGTFGPRRADPQSGKPFTVAQGESIHQRVGLLVHRDDVHSGKVAQRYRQYIEGNLY